MSDTERILFLSRVFPENCLDIELALEDKLTEGLSDDNLDIDQVIYDRIPNVFTTLDTWLKCTNLLCWNCDASFDTVPLFCPTYKYENTPGKPLMKPLGNFCTFPCSAKHNDIHAPPEEKWTRTKLLLELYTIFTGQTISKIPLAPDKTQMIQWGGFLTREQYDDAISLSMSSYQKTLNDNSIASIEVNQLS